MRREAVTTSAPALAIQSAARRYLARRRFKRIVKEKQIEWEWSTMAAEMGRFCAERARLRCGKWQKVLPCCTGRRAVVVAGLSLGVVSRRPTLCPPAFRGDRLTTLVRCISLLLPCSMVAVVAGTRGGDERGVQVPCSKSTAIADQNDVFSLHFLDGW